MRVAVQIDGGRRCGKSLFADAMAALSPSPVLKRHAVQLANARRAERELGPTSWAELTASGQVHFVHAALHNARANRRRPRAARFGEVTVMVPPQITDEFTPSLPPVDDDADTGHPWCEYCGEELPLSPVFTNGVGWRHVCTDCAAFLNGDAPDDDDDDDPDAATGCADDHL